MLRILLFIRKSILEIIFFIFSYLIGILFVLNFGFLESIGLSIELILGFFSALLFRNYIWRRAIRKKSSVRRKQILVELIVFFLLLQIFLFFVIPISSVISNKILVKMHVIYPVESVCNITEPIRKIKNLWKSGIEYEKVNIVEGGLMRHLWLLQERGFIQHGHARTAMTFGNTIYIYDLKECPSDDLYFHEMTHVWQMQKVRSKIFGISAVPTWLRNFYLQVANPETLYNYGGEAGLNQAREKGKKFLDFGIEQQAMIVEDWYWMNINNKNSDGENITQKYKELLEYYVSQLAPVS